MANKLTRKRPNRLLTGRNNYYSLGSTLKSAFGKEGGAWGAVGSAVGGLAGSSISGGMLTGVGNALQSLSGIASAIPGPWGAAIGAGLQAVGGLTNRMFGSKMNEENIAKVEGNINLLNSFTTNASDFDTLANNWANADAGMTFDDSFIGKDGWFSNKAKNKAADLRNQVEAGKAFVQNSLNNNAENISASLMLNLLANYTAYGGPLFAFGGDLMTHGATFDTGVTLVSNGGKHELNPYEGVPMGVDQEGVPNLVEEGEVIFNDYVFSNRLKVPKAVRNKYKLKGKKPITFADAAILMSKESEERPNDPISKNGLEALLGELAYTQELLRTRKKKANTFAKGGKLGRIYAGEEGDPYSLALALGMGPINTGSMWALNAPQPQPEAPKKNEMGIVLGGYTSNPTIIKPGESTIPEIINTQESKYSSPSVDDNKGGNLPSLAPTWMRYTPAFASGIMSVTDALGLTNKPDYGEAEAVLEASRGAGTYQPVKFNPVGNYLTYNPFDKEYYTNKLNAESSAARRAILNTSGGNRALAMAGILAADYNSQGKMGDLFRLAEEYNLAQRQKVEEFNRATNMFNSEGIFKADQANQSALLNARLSYLRGALTASELRQKERQAAAASRSVNLSNFINSLGDIGRENFSRNMIISDPSKYYSIGSNGEVTYKNSFHDLSEAEQDYITGHANRKSKSKKSKGEYLTIRRR